MLLCFFMKNKRTKRVPFFFQYHFVYVNYTLIMKSILFYFLKKALNKEKFRITNLEFF